MVAGAAACGGRRRGIVTVDLARGPQYELCWVDSFHTAGGILMSTGGLHADGVIRVTGSYQAGEERWGWRTEISIEGGELMLRAFNVLPSGEESPAIEGRWTRV